MNVARRVDLPALLQIVEIRGGLRRRLSRALADSASRIPDRANVCKEPRYFPSVTEATFLRPPSSAVALRRTQASRALVELIGFEPTTSALQGRRSPN
jgi:hypothetical protein